MCLHWLRGPLQFKHQPRWRLPPRCWCARNTCVDLASLSSLHTTSVSPLPSRPCLCRAGLSVIASKISPQTPWRNQLHAMQRVERRAFDRQLILAHIPRSFRTWRGRGVLAPLMVSFPPIAYCPLKRLTLNNSDCESPNDKPRCR